MKDEHDKRTLDMLTRTTDPILPTNEWMYQFVPVAMAAKDFKVTARRIRALLAGKRLQGIRRANGYWDVVYPYNFTFGRRGPALKRSQKPEKDAKKPELRAV
jgi:hypothetical protein